MKKQALIIEDNKSDQMLTKSFLEYIGCECTVTYDCDGAVKHLLSKKFDIIVLDINMPQMNGIQFLIGFREAPLAKNTSVIVVSGNDLDAYLSQAEMFGAKVCIKKPLNITKHKPLIEKYLIENIKEDLHE